MPELSSKFAKYSPVFYWSAIFSIVAPILASLILLWIGNTRVSEFHDYHQQIGHGSIELLAEEISTVITEKQRLVELFSKLESKHITRLSKNPDNDELYKGLQKKLQNFFPNMFTFTIANQEGIPYLDDFDGLIGEICLADITQMLKVKQHKVRIHPNPIAYHYDIIAPWNDHGIFFVSFKPEIISRLLVAASPAGHELKVIIQDPSHLLEIDEQGARNKTPKLDYRLTDNEKSRILNSVKVGNSHWHLIDMHESNLFSDFSKSTYLTYGIIVTIFFILSISVIFLLLYFEKKKIALEKMREEMQAILSHDLRSPLVSLSGTITLLEGAYGQLDPEQIQNLLSTSSFSIVNMQRIVDEIVDINRLETGKMDFEFSEIELNGFIDEAIDLNTSYADRFSVTIAIGKKEDGLKIIADRGRLHQVMSNLLSNAIKYSPSNGTVEIGYYQEHGNAVIYVKDNGPGIPESFQPHIFEKFSQNKSKLNTLVPSSGLGLAITKNIVEAHNGRIDFKSNEEKGTIFFLKFNLLT